MSDGFEFVYCGYRVRGRLLPSPGGRWGAHVVVHRGDGEDGVDHFAAVYYGHDERELALEHARVGALHWIDAQR